MADLTLILEESPDNQIDILLGQFVATPASVIQYANAAAASASSANLSQTNAGVSATASAGSATAAATSATQAATSASNAAGSATAAATSAASAAFNATLTTNPLKEIFNAGTGFTVGAASITLANSYGSVDNIDIYADGVPQLDSTLTGLVLGFPNGGAPNCAQIIVRGRRALAIAVPSDNTVTTLKIADASVTPGKNVPGSGGFYSDLAPAPIVWKFADRVRIGTSQALNADLAWSVSPVFTTPFGWQERDSTLFVASAGRIAISAFSQSSKNVGPFPGGPFFPGAPALNGLAFNDDLTHGSLMWAGYLEAYRVAGAGATYGLELDIGEGGTGVILDPYTFAGSATTGIQVSSGGSTGLTYGGPAGAAYVAGNNGNTFYRGFVVNHDALSSVGGQAPAAYSMAATQCIAWFNASGNVSTNIVSTVVPGQANNFMQFNNNQVALGQNGQSGAFIFNFASATAANGITFQASNAGAGFVNIAAVGGDANLDLALSGAGTGVLKFGAYTAGVVTQAGYITVKDSGGTVRRLLVG